MSRPDFSRIWGSDNAPFTPIEASDYAAGWVFRTGAPPRRVNFDYFQNLADERAIWLDQNKANLDSPIFTGTPTAPNPSTGLRSQALATMQKFADEFGSSLASDGYQKLPSGLIIQWGSRAGGPEPSMTAFPVTFPNQCFSVVLTCSLPTDPTSTVTYSVSAMTASNFTVLRIDPSSSNVEQFRYIAIGN